MVGSTKIVGAVRDLESTLTLLCQSASTFSGSQPGAPMQQQFGCQKRTCDRKAEGSNWRLGILVQGAAGYRVACSWHSWQDYARICFDLVRLKASEGYELSFGSIAQSSN